MSAEASELERFVRGEMDARSFPHREHARMAFEMLRRHDFVEAALHYSRALRVMSARAGNPQAFHQTITIAFLSLIAERMQQCAASADFEALVRAYPELLDKSALSRWYPAERLASEAARRTFLLPQPPP